MDPALRYEALNLVETLRRASGPPKTYLIEVSIFAAVEIGNLIVYTANACKLRPVAALGGDVWEVTKC